MEDQVAEKESESLGADEVAHRARLREAHRLRERQALELQRENILGQRTSNANRRAALEAALADVEAKLKKLSA